MLGLSICIPVLNEERAIAVTLRQCLDIAHALRQAGIGRLEVVVVDDGSTDSTADRVREFPEVRLIQHPVNRGYGAALKTGFDAARYELIGFIDADATYPPDQFPALCRALIDQRADLVVGSRMAGAESEMPLTRRVGNLVFARLLTIIGGARVTDSASGMRVFRREALQLVSPLPDGLNLTPVMSARALHEQMRVLEVAIPYHDRVGRSHLRIGTDGVVFLRTIVWTVLSYNPVRVLGLIGLAGVLLAAMVGAWLVVARLAGVTALGPWGTFAIFGALVSAVTGVSIFALGASFNYLVSLFHRRPIRQGLFRRPLISAPIERWFLPLGLAAGLVGAGAAAVSLTLALRGWPIERLWLYLSASASAILIGTQLACSWLMMSVLRELAARAATQRS
jgi:glycosyltransferase involved in cell wall biosynthesis